MTDDGIDGVVLVPLEWNRDDRGAFAELFRQEWVPGAPPMVQANLSRSRAGVLRGMHFHKEQADFWILLEGRQFVALYDLRPSSPTSGQKLELSLDAQAELRGLYVPPGVAHGFYAVSDVEMLYLVDLAYTGDDVEREFHTPKGCEAQCTIGCVRRASAFDGWRAQQGA